MSRQANTRTVTVEREAAWEVVPCPGGGGRRRPAGCGPEAGTIPA